MIVGTSLPLPILNYQTSFIDHAQCIPACKSSYEGIYKLDVEPVVYPTSELK